ncbi:MAG: 50S ribosomal protein L16 [Candidatus Methylacidiphilales bacterium]
MPLLPKRVKYRKQQRGSRAGNAKRGTTLAFGSYGLQALERGWLTNTQIEACRIAINRHMKRKGQLWIRIFPDKPVSKRPPETRMGKGKSNPEFWVAVIKPGRLLFEVDGLSESMAKEAIRLAANKLPIRTRFISRERKLVA